MTILKAQKNDLPEILALQKKAFLSEAISINNHSIQPLTQTLEEIEDEFSKGLILKLTDEKSGQIIGSVRAYEENDRVFIGKLIVYPEFQNKGLGHSLLNEIEKYYPNKSFELFTNSKNKKNINLYLKNGYKNFKLEKISDTFSFIYFEK